MEKTELDINGNYTLDLVRKLNLEESFGLACSFRHKGDLCPSSADIEVKKLDSKSLYPCCTSCLIEFGFTEKQINQGETK